MCVDCVSAHVYRCSCLCRGQKTLLSALPYHSLPHFSKAGFLTEPEARLAASKPKSLLSTHLQTVLRLQECITTLFFFFHVGAWDFRFKSSCSHNEHSYPLSHLSSPAYLCVCQYLCFLIVLGNPCEKVIRS